MEGSPLERLGSDRKVDVSLLCDDQPKDPATPEMVGRSKAGCFLDIPFSAADRLCVRKKKAARFYISPHKREARGHPFQVTKGLTKGNRQAAKSEGS
ncbi:hypothetical protein A7K73_09935 [Candidatus Methylacidiphilum fumarolicum]|nr:hypothetical protein A7K73_09935 [Candidatus Methylacidiphilum fumarolicum]